MTKLIFKNERLKGLLALTMKATTFRATFSEMITAYENATGKTYESYPEVDLSPYGIHSNPTVWLVKDHGIYLMASAVVSETPPDYSHLCYAEGFRPDDPDSWDKCRAAVGGDDFVEALPFSKDMQKIVERGADIHIVIAADTITIKLTFSKKK